jgi:hypothetical protein
VLGEVDVGEGWNGWKLSLAVGKEGLAENEREVDRVRIGERYMAAGSGRVMAWDLTQVS